MLSKTLFGFALFMSWCYTHATTTAPPLSTFQGTLSEAQVAAKVSNRPLLLYIYQEDHPSARQMKRNTWEDQGVRDFLYENFVVYFMPLEELAQPANLRYHLTQLPTLLFIHPKGHLMGSVEGNVAPRTLSNMLTRYHQRISPTTGDHFAVRRPTPPPMPIQLAHPGSNFELQVSGMESYSFSRLQLTPAPNQPPMGLLAGSYGQVPQLERAMRRMERIWPGEMYVYADLEDNSKPVYKLVLGAFDDKDLAQRYADAMSRYAAIDVHLLDLSPLVAER